MIRIALFIFGLTALLVTLSSCENDMAEVQRLVDLSELSRETLIDVEMLYSDSAVLRVKVKGPKMFRYLDKNEPKQEFPEGVHVLFYGENSTIITSELTAKYAIRFENKSEVFVRDSVVLESINKEKLETNELIWDESKQIVYSDKFVKITTPEEQIYGYGFEANQDFTRWTIKAIEGKIKVDELTNDLK